MKVFFNRGWGGWGLPTHLLFFLAGPVIYSHHGLQDRIRRQRWLSLGAGLLLLLAVGVIAGGPGEEAFGTPEYALVTMLHSLASWCLVLGILGLGMQYLAVYRLFLGYAGPAVLPFYILHQSVILVVGYFGAVVHSGPAEVRRDPGQLAGRDPGPVRAPGPAF